MADDPATRAIGMYLEGVRDGRRFFASLRRAAARHPVVIWKGGTTEAGARATFSHTGSLATAAAVWRALMVQSGAVSVASLDAMLDAMELLARGRRVGGRGMGLVAMTGGQSVVITDTFAAAGLEVPALSEASYAELKGFFNIIGGSYRNPLDAGGTIGMGHDQGNLDRILDILERDAAIDAIVLEIGTGLRAARWPTHEEELTGLLDKLAEFNRRSHKAFAVILHPAHVEDDRRSRQGVGARPRSGGVRQLRARGRRVRASPPSTGRAEAIRDVRSSPESDPTRRGSALTCRRDHGERAGRAVAVEDHQMVGARATIRSPRHHGRPARQHECLAVDDREGDDFAHRAGRSRNE